ncbi:MAG: bifunctional DNA-formamidopyrimidine glycosylase/DNA-(apurinic or apyrimidinic site) lyase [Syntrophotaleaceae bacterium]
MPELPEVETIRRGIAPFVVGHTVRKVILRTPMLRWPIPTDLPGKLEGETIEEVDRRGKYLLFRTAAGTLLIHLGMSGYLRVLESGRQPGKHDHADIEFFDGLCLRLNDTRRFGALLWIEGDPLQHPLLAGLGPEPLSDAFTGDYLHARSRYRITAVKALLMDSRIVVGVGNIYASESLYRARIDPRKAAGNISLARYRRLAESVRQVLQKAIAAGGTTLRDFSDQNGRPGYFALQLMVYGREGEPCPACGRAVQRITLGQRSTFFCPHCQK